MFSFDVMTFLWILLAALVAGFGWAAGVWLWGQLTRPRAPR